MTGSLLSLLLRVPSEVLASVALCIANDHVQDRTLSLESTPSCTGSSAWFLSCVVWVCFLQFGAGSVRFSRRASSLSLSILLSLAPLQNVRSWKLQSQFEPVD